MPKRALTPCCYPSCSALTDSRYCAEHATVANREYNKYTRDPETAKRYGKDWKRVRAAYARAHPLCEECLKAGRYVPVEEVHHIKPLAEGGTNDFENLMSLCRSCHSKITAAAGFGHGKKDNFYGDSVRV